MADHPLADRLDSFRKMGAEARRDAERAKSAEMKDGYEQLAKSWDQLIGEIEAAMKPGKRL
jgi:Ribonuclease G/E